jgi:cytochrome c oxidase cbb3-type subunit IV
MAMSILLLLLVAAFVGVIVWVFGRNRKARFAKDARIPLDEDSQEPPIGGQN